MRTDWIRTIAALAFAIGAGATTDAQSRAIDRADAMDRNRDGVITRSEWSGESRSFEMHDWNRDGVLSGDEVTAASRSAERRSEAGTPDDDDRSRRLAALQFAAQDQDGDERISTIEWQGTYEQFESLDRNRDYVLTLDELAGTDSRDVRSSAYRQGYQRGLAEGRQAGREDGTRNVWDLEGQRELEAADSGYDLRMGSLQEYQAGYRDGFRSAYPEGFRSR